MKHILPIRLIFTVLLGFLALGARAQVGLPPVIVVQPLGVSVSQGGTVVLTVVAASATSMTYKWYRNNAVVGGATGSTVTLNNLGTGQAGTYRVEVKNSAGTTVSGNAVVVVTPRLKVQLPVKAARMKANGFEIQMDNLTVPKAVIYASTDMVNWNPISTNVVAAGAATFVDTTALGRPCRYYKVMDE